MLNLGELTALVEDKSKLPKRHGVLILDDEARWILLSEKHEYIFLSQPSLQLWRKLAKNLEIAICVFVSDLHVRERNRLIEHQHNKSGAGNNEQESRDTPKWTDSNMGSRRGHGRVRHCDR
jgi:hypothetical protein